MVDAFIALFLLLSGVDSPDNIDFTVCTEAKIQECYQTDTKGLSYDAYKQAWYEAQEAAQKEKDGGAVIDVIAAD